MHFSYFCMDNSTMIVSPFLNHKFGLETCAFSLINNMSESERMFEEFQTHFSRAWNLSDNLVVLRASRNDGIEACNIDTYFPSENENRGE